MANPNPLEMLCDYALYKSTFTLQSISGQPRWASYKWNWKDTSRSAVFTNVQSIPISLFNYCSLFHPVYLTSNCLSVTHKLYPDSLWSTSLGLISSTSVYTSIIHWRIQGRPVPPCPHPVCQWHLASPAGKAFCMGWWALDNTYHANTRVILRNLLSPGVFSGSKWSKIPWHRISAPDPARSLQRSLRPRSWTKGK